MRNAGVEGDVTPIAVALGAGAGLPIGLWGFLSVRIVTGSATSSMRITAGFESRENILHLMTGQALPLPRPQCSGSRVSCSQKRNFSGELMALIAVQRCLGGHFPEPDVNRLMTP